MKQRLIVILTIGAVVLFCDLIYWSKQTGKLSRSVLTFEPTYEGETLSYWVAHWHQQYGEPNLQAHEAIKAMGSNAAPYLGEMMARYAMVDAGTANFTYCERLLQAFEILGPAAQPAIPYLIKGLGRNSDYYERALISIGKASVPPLADKLLVTLHDTKNPFYQGAIRMGVHQDSGFFIRGRILSVFDQMGTNAEAALPALVFAASTNLPIYHVWLNHQNIYATLAIVGRNHPEVVVPPLLNKFTNSVDERGDIAKAIALMGTNQTKIFIPVLIAALFDKSTDANSRSEIGETLTVISATNETILLPVFLTALTDQSSPEPVRCAMAGYLSRIGTNQSDLVVPALKSAYTNASLFGRSLIAGALAAFPKQSRSVVPLMLADCRKKPEHSSDNRWRIKLTFAMKSIAPDMPGTLTPLLEDLNNPQAGIRQQTIQALEKLGTNAQEGIPALLKCLTHPDWVTRHDAIHALNNLGVKSDEFIHALGDNLSHTNDFVVRAALESLAGLADHSKLAFVTLIKKGICGQIGRDERWQAKWALINISRNDPTYMLECLDDSDAQVRSGALIVFYELERGVPSSIPKLRELATRDPDSDVRSRAADVLKLQLQ